MSSNEYMNTYMKNRYQKRKLFALEYLGGKCSKCNSVENLQFDHINRDEKNFTLADGMLWSEKKFLEELNKCQLLCVICHQKKTLIDLNQSDGKNTHGTLTSYKYCKCELCKKAKSDYMKEYRKTYKRKSRRKNMEL